MTSNGHEKESSFPAEREFGRNALDNPGRESRNETE
jgi:hypothetical protein